MDPLTQGALGAALPLATRRGKPAGVAAGCGFLAGLAPDLDIVLRDPEDTLLFLEFHRQFTHALIFIPVGSAIVAGALFGLARRWLAMGLRPGLHHPRTSGCGHVLRHASALALQ